MSVDLASLALRIDSTEVKTGVAELDKLTAAGTKTEAAVEGVGRASDKAATSTKTASQAAAEMARQAQAAAAGGNAYAAAYAQADAAIVRLAGAQAEATREVARSTQAYKAGEISLEAYNAELLRTRAGLSLVEAEHNQAIGALRRHSMAQTTANDSIGGFTKVTGGAAFAARNLNYQLVDMATGLSMGMPPLMIMMQQVPQAADAFSMLAKESGGAGSAIAGLATKFAPLLLAVGAIAGALALVTKEINDNSEVQVTWMDTALGAYDAVAAAVSGVLVDAFDYFGTTSAQVWETVVAYATRATDMIIGKVTLVPRLLITSWQVLPGAVADIGISTANAFIRTVNDMVQRAVAILNGFVATANIILDRVNLGIPTLTAPQIGELQNSYAGAARAAGNAYLQDFRDTVQRGWTSEIAEAISPYAQARNRARAEQDAEDVGRSAGGRMGAALGDAAGRAARSSFGEAFADLADEVNDRLKAATREAEIRIQKDQEYADQVRDKTKDAAEERWQAEQEAIEEANRALKDFIGNMRNLGGVGSTVAGIFEGLQTGDFGGLGKVGGLLNVLGSAQSGELGQAIESMADRISAIFGVSGEFSKALANGLMAAGIGQAAGSLVFGKQNGAEKAGSMAGGLLGNLAGDAFGDVIGKAAGSVLGPMMGQALGAAMPVIGNIVGGILGSALGGMIGGTPKGAVSFNGGGVTGTFFGNDARIGQSQDLAGSIIDSLNRIAERLGGAVNAAAGAASIGIRKDDIMFDPTGSGAVKTGRGAINFGDDAEGAVMAAIMDLINDGVLTGLRAGTEALIRNASNLEQGIADALAFEEVFKELARATDPVAAATSELNTEFDKLRSLFARAGATTEERAQLEELYQRKLNEITAQGGEAAEEVSRVRELEVQLMQAQGNTMGALALARELELEKLTDAEAVVMQQIWAQQLSNDIRNKEIELLAAQGYEAEALAMQREIERAAMHESLRDIQDRIWAAQDEAKAAQEAAQAAADLARVHEEEARAAEELARTTRGLELQILALTDPTAELAARRADELAALPESVRWMLERVHQLQDEQEAARLAAQAAEELARVQEQAAADAARMAEEAARAAQALADETRSLQIRYLDLTDATAALEARRADELAGVNEVNRELLNLIYRTEDAAAAAQVLAAEQEALARAQEEAAQEAARIAQEVAREAARIADERAGLERRILELLGDTAAIRELELAALDPTNRALQVRINALIDEQAATEALAQAQAEAARIAEQAAEEALQLAKRIADERTGLERRILELTGDTAALRQLELDALDPSNRELQERINALIDEQAAAELARQAQEEMARAAEQLARAAEQAAAEAIRAAEEAARRVAEIARERTDLTIRLYELEGRTAEATAMRRQLQLEAVDASNAAILRQIWVLEDAAVAAAEAEQAQAEYNEAVRQQTALINDARDNLSAAYKREAGAIGETIDKFSEFGKSLREFRAGLFAADAGTADAYRQAQVKFMMTSALAQSGDVTALGELQGVSSAFLEASRSQASSAVSYQRDVAAVARAVDAAIGAADEAVDYQQEQLNALNSLVGGFIDINESVLSVADAIQQLEIALAGGGATPDLIPVVQVSPNGGQQQQQVEVLTASNADLRSEIVALREEIRAGLTTVASNTRKTSDILGRADGGDYIKIGNDEDTPVYSEVVA